MFIRLNDYAILKRIQLLLFMIPFLHLVRKIIFSWTTLDLNMIKRGLLIWAQFNLHDYTITSIQSMCLRPQNFEDLYPMKYP